MSTTRPLKLAAQRCVSVTPTRLRYVYGAAAPRAILAQASGRGSPKCLEEGGSPRLTLPQ
jgi:hypothetical protein